MKATGFYILLMLSLFLTIKGYSQNSFIKLSSLKKHELEIKEVASGTYEITATGGDPYLFSSPLQAAIASGSSIMTFEYFSTDYLDQFQVFFGPEISENHSASAELGIREGWTSHSIDMEEEIKKWGKKGDFLRLDFGNKSGYKIQIRNIRFRKPNIEEIAKAANKEVKKKEEAAYKLKLVKYLDRNYTLKLSSVAVTETTVAINGITEKGRNNLFLVEVPLYQDIALSLPNSDAILIPSDKSEFSLNIPRYKELAGRQSDRLLSKWVIAEKDPHGFSIKSHARYADEIFSKNQLPEEKPRSKKGLGGFSKNRFTSDLDSLDITSATVNMWITQMMRSKASDKTITFYYNGNEYFADKKWVENQDQTLRETAKRNIVVSSIILIDKAMNCPDKEIGSIFQHPDCDPSGIYSMANMTNQKSTEYYAAAIDFLAKRYSRVDNKYGRIHSWIAHNEVDAGWVWTNMGEKDTLVFMDTYHKSMRLIHNITRQYNPHAKTFITLTHYWNWTVDKHFYHSRDLLNILLKYSALEGDFDWGIAHHPYPESLFEPKSWEDKKVDFTFNTPLITFKNIEVLNAWVKQPYTMFKNKYKRTVYLSEQGPNSKDYTEQNLNEQAASMAYLWKKMEVLDGIDAYQFHNWIDNRGEGGLRIGLRRFPDDEQDPGGKKPVWYVYRDLGTKAESKTVDFAKKIIGIKEWKEVQYKNAID